jgi:hypothetical protein
VKQTILKQTMSCTVYYQTLIRTRITFYERKEPLKHRSRFAKSFIMACIAESITIDKLDNVLRRPSQRYHSFVHTVVLLMS